MDALLFPVAPIKKRRKSKRGKEISEKWEPSPDDIKYGIALGLTENQIAEFAEDMRLWGGANANRNVARKKNWSLAFKGWMRREIKKQRGANGQDKSTTAAADRLIANGFKLSPKPGSLAAIESAPNLFMLPESGRK